MNLDLSKLENVSKVAHGKTTARCPACAAGGGDEKGNHLVIYEEGKYGCVAYPDDNAHRKEIFALVGKAGGAGVPARLTVQTYRAPESQVVMDLGRFARFGVQRIPQISTAIPPAAEGSRPNCVTAVPEKLRIDEWVDATEVEVLQEV